MSAWLDQIKFNMSNQLNKVYKDAKANANPEEWFEFETWFWKIKPLILVDVSKYVPGGNSETSGPNFCVKSDLQKV